MPISEPHSRKVLLIDDCADDRLLVREYLMHGILQYSAILEAKNLDEAREHLRAHNPACIILDYRIGAKSGLKFLEEIALVYTPENQPMVISLTGSTHYPIFKAAAKKLGVSIFLSKHTLTEDVLCTKVSLAISASMTPRPAQSDHPTM